MTADDVIAAARSALGIPFRHQGRSLAGMDCAGLIVHVAATLGLDYFDQSGYARTPSNGLLEAALDSQPCIERVSSMRCGDVLLMRFHGDPQHLGIYTGENLIHAYSTIGKVCEHRLSDVWRSRIVRVYRFKGIEQ